MTRAGRSAALTGLALALVGAAPPDNRAIVTDFAQLFYVERNVRKAFERHVVPDYVQHNPNMAPGKFCSPRAQRLASSIRCAASASSPGAR